MTEGNAKQKGEKRVLCLNPETFALLVRQLRKFHDSADLFEIDLDHMKVKGDLRVIQNSFDKPLIGRTSSLDMAKRAAKAGLPYVKIPKDLKLDADFLSLVRIKKTILLGFEDKSVNNSDNSKHFTFLEILLS